MDPDAKAKAWEAYRQLNDSPMQRRLREEAPCLVGAVHWNPQKEGTDDVRYELQRMKDTGFTYVRFHCIGPFDYHCDDDADDRLDFTVTDMYVDLAHEVGLIAYPHFAFGKFSASALKQVGLSEDEASSLGPGDDRVQEAVRMRMLPVLEHYRNHPAIGAWPVSGEPNATGIPLRDNIEKKRFIAWLQQRHDSPETLNLAWSIYPQKRKPLVGSWEAAADLLDGVSFENKEQIATTGISRHELYGAIRDLARFRADQANEWVRLRAQIVRDVDPVRPVFVGNHQFFINNAQLGWDIFESARTGDCHFSSIHISWHFEQVWGELDRPVYMTAKMTNDAFKGGLTSAYETTGGPVQYSGGYGNHMDAGLMRKLMFSYLASGNENIAFWCWRPRPGGIESGEYGLVTLSGKISEWAKEAGKVSRRMQQYAREIWDAYEEPELGVLRSWDSEAICLLEPMRNDLRSDGPTAWSRGSSQQHMRALIGASRVAINSQVAYEYVTERELLEGIACCYPTIYLPHVRACSMALLDTLLAYVEAGGRLVADVQFAFCDQWGKLHKRGKGTILERMFGAWVDAFHDARTRPLSVDGIPARNFYGQIETTAAEVLATFDNGMPAVTQADVGKGQSVLVGFDPARECWLPDNPAMEEKLGALFRGPFERRWECDLPMTFRRSGDGVDHWFLINDGDARKVALDVEDRNYSALTDVMSEEQVDPSKIDVPAYSGLWLRAE